MPGLRFESILRGKSHNFSNLPNHRMGTHFLRPSSVLTNRAFSDRTLHHTVDRKFRPVSAIENHDPNVVIAAYGTQVTLHRNDSSKPSHSRPSQTQSKVVRKERPRVRILVPTESETDSAQMKIVIAEPNSHRPNTDFAERNVADNKTGEAEPKNLLSDCSTDDRIDTSSSEGTLVKENDHHGTTVVPNRTSTTSNYGRWRHTAWDKPTDETASVIPGIATFVDFKNFKTDQEFRVSASSEEKRNAMNSSCDSSTAPYSRFPSSPTCGCIPQHQIEIGKRSFLLDSSRKSSNRDAPVRIKEVWGARQKNEVSTKMEFCHETLRRPRSAFASLPYNESTTHGIPSTLPRNCTESNQNTITNSYKRRPARRQTRKDRPKSAFPRGKDIPPNFDSEHLAPGTCALLDAKSLIRQNHRPTTAIKYCKPDKGTVPSITPCVRKARVSHAMYVTMHNHNSELVRVDSNGVSPRSPTKNQQTLDLSLNASGMMKLRRSRKTDSKDKTEKDASANTAHQRLTAGEEPCNHADTQGTNTGGTGLHEKTKIDVDLNFNEWIKDSTPESANHSYKGNQENGNRDLTSNYVAPEKCEPLRLLLEQSQSEITNSPKLPDTNNEKENSVAAKIPPLSAAYVYALEENCGNKKTELYEITQKNKMIRRWLEEVEVPNSDNVADKIEIQSISSSESG